LIVRFDTLSVARPQSESRDVILRRAAVWVTDGSHQLIGQSGDKDLGSAKLMTNQPTLDLSSVQFEVKNAGKICETRCFVTAVAETASGANAQSEPIELQLGAGKAVAAAPPPDARDSRCSFTAAQASQALGQPIKYQTMDGNECVLVPASPTAARFALLVLNSDHKAFQALTKKENAEMMTIGDRAVWIPPAGPNGTSILSAEKGKWTVQVTMFVADRPGRPVEEMRQQSQVTVNKMLEKLVE
jgi:hypothetical protein